MLLKMEDLAAELMVLADSWTTYVIRSTTRMLATLKTLLTLRESSFWWPYIGAFVLWAAWAFKTTYQGKDIRSFLRFCFPKEFYFHRSTATDVQVYLMNLFFQLPSLVFPGVGAAVVATTILGLDWSKVESYPLGPWESIPFLLVWVLTEELGYYAAHRMYHRVPFLWEFHKVHHSAEVLTPLTIFRKHPAFDATSGMFITLIRGVVLAALVATFNIEFSAVHILGLTVYKSTFRFFGQHLRHSHIWWAWDRRISHVFISPAQHQIHHSYLPEHLNKNFGEVFALWDWLFGSLYVAGEREDLAIGLGEEHEITNGVAAYLVPFRNIGRMAQSSIRRWVR